MVHLWKILHWFAQQLLDNWTFFTPYVLLGPSSPMANLSTLNTETYIYSACHTINWVGM